jgi:hypothetical protein
VCASVCLGEWLIVLNKLELMGQPRQRGFVLRGFGRLSVPCSALCICRCVQSKQPQGLLLSFTSPCSSCKES